MDQKRQSNNFVEDLYSQINKLSLEIAESKKVCDNIIIHKMYSFSENLLKFSLVL